MIIISILPSYYFGDEVIVIETSCGHKHLRPKSIYLYLRVGDMFECWCERTK